jgi:hypothetical protein
MLEDEEYARIYKAFRKERNEKHFYLRQRGFIYKCSAQYPLDYYDLCISLWQKHFGRNSMKFKEQKEKYLELLSLSNLEIRELRIKGIRQLIQPNQEQPDGVCVDVEGEKVIIPKWKEIGTQGGQFDDDSEDDA